MNKYWIVLLMALGLISCNEKNEQYYLSHPKELQTAMSACPSQPPQGLTCQQLEQLAARMNVLVYQLQANPQAFGVKILTLQQTIAKQQLVLKEKGANAELQFSLKQNQQDLADLLTVVKWLESPEG